MDETVALKDLAVTEWGERRESGLRQSQGGHLYGESSTVYTCALYSPPSTPRQTPVIQLAAQTPEIQQRSRLRPASQTGPRALSPACSRNHPADCSCGSADT